MSIELRKREKDMTGLTFNRLTVISPSEKIRGGERYWYCQCQCGELCCVRGANLRNGGSKSCGCINKEHMVKRNTTHGQRFTPTYQTWLNMIQRCTNPKASYYYRYGGRGITVCLRWRESYENFLFDMGTKPEGLTIDRIDSNQGYFPGNVRWASQQEQAVNKDQVRNAKGYSKHKSGKFGSRIHINSKLIYLGTFDTPEEAQEKYEYAKMKLDLQELMD